MDITRTHEGRASETVPLGEIEVPDLWAVSRGLEDRGFPEAAELVRENWHLALDLRRALWEIEKTGQ